MFLTPQALSCRALYISCLRFRASQLCYRSSSLSSNVYHHPSKRHLFVLKMEKIQPDRTEYSDANTRNAHPNDLNEVNSQNESQVPSGGPSSGASRKFSSSSTSSSITNDFLKLNIQTGGNLDGGASLAANEVPFITTDDDSDGVDGGVRLDALASASSDNSRIPVLSLASTAKPLLESQNAQPLKIATKKKRTRNRKTQSNVPPSTQNSTNNPLSGDNRQGVGTKKTISHKGKGFPSDSRWKTSEAVIRMAWHHHHMMYNSNSSNNWAALESETNQSIRMVPASTPKFQASHSPGRKGYKPSSRMSPVPTPEYMAAASAPVSFLAKPVDKSILVVLDLNGTLLFRNRQYTLNVAKASANPDLRPHLSPFLDYLFSNCQVMIWSSATPKNVTRMIQACFTAEQQSKLLACWGRDTLGLSANDYGTKTITYKRLDRVFTKIKTPNGAAWDHTNTILIDDSAVKAQSHPHNHIEIPDFDEMLVKRGNDNALAEVAGYLDALRWTSSVATVIQKTPFKIGQGWKAPWIQS